MVICPHCGIRNRINSNFCNNCGADLREERPTRAEPRAPAGPSNTEDAANEQEADAEPPIHFEPDPRHPQWEEEEGGADDSEIPLYGENFDAPAREIDDIESSIERIAGVGEAGDDGFTPANTDLVGDFFARLSRDVPGLLPPHSVSIFDRADASPEQATLRERTPALAETDLSRLRNLLNEAPAITRTPIRLRTQSQQWLAAPWIVWLLALCMLAPFFVGLSSLPESPRPLPGVAAAFAAIDALPADSLLLVWWVYDPATAGEMDLVTLPLLRHLSTQRQQLFLFTPLPTGVATAERLFARLDTEVNLEGTAAMMRSADYLPGGPAVLPLIGQNLAAAARDTTAQGRANANGALGAPVSPGQPVLSLVVAAQAEDVQYWLEQVQPRNELPVVAATGAAADPILRPYLDSGQLSGLISGVDGGLAYEAQLEETAASGAPRLSQLAIASRFHMIQMQNWGHIGFLLIILLGNLALLVNGKTYRQTI